jgi:hypothetical protein
MNKSQTYYFIGRILSLDFFPNNKDVVARQIVDDDVNWPGFVKLGSDKLVLPALYYQLSKHGLHQLLPSDLDQYLKEIFLLNRQRNQNVIRLATFVRDVFQKNGIQTLFMKGVGNILDGLYQDTGVRMVYDVDVLVSDGKMLEAAELLQQEGFITQKKFNPRSLDSTMHYPILLREDFVAGVEVHRKPGQYLYEKVFNNERVWNDIKISSQYRGFQTMNFKNRIIHNFLHAQLMHSGHFHADVSPRDLYDLLLLGEKEDLYETFASLGQYTEASTGYLKLMYQVFGLEMPSVLYQKKAGRFFLWRHKKVLQMRSRQLRRYHLFLLFFQKYLILPLRVLVNARARNYVFARLSDISWYGTHWRSMKRRIQTRR